ncbi:undecaprenyldiphospho-muramoylpentapeptide beta-N-acetylglucosaminyltransferase [Alteribacter populi]|uniref:undecaprenyldiphospho-muramoylpentapeptide beta-N-acetylglucosaminyltransferase n=1 Tax=Alteribacter populi TaxID=2011011 RepID=UPI000BBAC4EB|nr:undecaprenyldiphospho-muramoylpentapeptide beta-N-acetylglucosaminyltransferase [Alteribacter populi]
MKVLISGGGTGGHIYPALALIEQIKKEIPNAEFLYIGSDNGLESRIVPDNQIPFKTVTISGFRRKLSVENVKTVLRFLKAVSTAKRYIRDFHPDVVIGTGGYVCGPVVFAAAKQRIPTLIHEQNSVPGLTNKFLSKYVDRVAISFEASKTFFPKEKVALTGNPRAQQVYEASLEKSGGRLTELGLDPNQKTVLIVGGSRGAKPINEAFLQAVPALKDKPFQCLYVTGDVHYESIKSELTTFGELTNIVCVPFIHDMPQVLKHVDLLVARAGATTLSETTALGLPSLLVPSPYVTNNHQEKNARALENNGAAKVIVEKELSADRLVQEMDASLEKENWQVMHEAAKAMGTPEAATTLRKLMEEVIAEKQ